MSSTRLANHHCVHHVGNSAGDTPNRVIERHRIGWAPAIHPPGALAHIIGELDPSGHTYVWELEPAGDGRTKVTHTYDWSGVRDQNALGLYPRASKEQMEGSVDRVAAAVA